MYKYVYIYIYIHIHINIKCTEEIEGRVLIVAVSESVWPVCRLYNFLLGLPPDEEAVDRGLEQGGEEPLSQQGLQRHKNLCQVQSCQSTKLRMRSCALTCPICLYWIAGLGCSISRCWSPQVRKKVRNLPSLRQSLCIGLVENSDVWHF